MREPGGDRQSEKHSRTDAEMLPMETAERDTGIDHRVVSRWRNGLADGPVEGVNCGAEERAP